MIAADDQGLVVEVESLATRLAALNEANGWQWSGLVMQAEPYVSTAGYLQWHDQEGPLHVMHVPEDVHRRWEDMQACIQMICEEAFE